MEEEKPKGVEKRDRVEEDRENVEVKGKRERAFKSRPLLL